MKAYAVIYEKGANGWGAYAPDLPGLGAAGSTLGEVKRLIREGIDFPLEGLLENGDPIPEPTTLVDLIETDVVERHPRRLAQSA